MLSWGGRVYSRYINVALQQHADGHLNHGLDAGLLIAVHFVYTDIVFAVAGSV